MLVNGYPGKFKGKAFKARGTIKEVTEGSLGGLLAYYDAPTLPGNSGSPVRIDNQEMLQMAIDAYKQGQDATSKSITSKGFEDRKYVACGIHVCFSLQRGLNVCTFITDEITQWEYDTIMGPECEQYFK